jgi:hypothetical protein
MNGNQPKQTFSKETRIMSDGTPTAGQTTTPPAAADQTPIPPRREPKPGDQVHLVHANKTHIDAVVDRFNRADNTVDLTFSDAGIETRITRSPFDPTGTKPDSWHFVEAQ